MRVRGFQNVSCVLRAFLYGRIPFGVQRGGLRTRQVN